jgi:hypothetical protein
MLGYYFFILLAAILPSNMTTRAWPTQPEAQKKQDIAQQPIAKDKWNLTYADKLWGLKLKAVKYVDKSDDAASGLSRAGSYKLLLEFTRDLKDEERAAAQRAFGLRALQGLELYFFDTDNVLRTKQTSMSIDGEVTGIKGDAFWLILSANFPKGPNVAKAQLRPREAAPTVGGWGRIVKVDSDKNTITVKGDEDKEYVVKVESSTKLVGPRGREIGGLSDKALKEGARGSWMLYKDGKVTELHLRGGREPRGEPKKRTTRNEKNKDN